MLLSIKHNIPIDVQHTGRMCKRCTDSSFNLSCCNDLVFSEMDKDDGSDSWEDGDEM